MSGRAEYSVLIEKNVATSARERPSRTETRMNVRLDAAFDWRGGAVRCRVHDLSRSGACVESDAPVRSGERISFCREALRVSGAVVWTRGRRFGIRFDVPIRATELLVQMSDSRRAQAPINAVFPST